MDLVGFISKRITAKLARMNLESSLLEGQINCFKLAQEVRKDELAIFSAVKGEGLDEMMTVFDRSREYTRVIDKLESRGIYLGTKARQEALSFWEEMVLLLEIKIYNLLAS